MSKTFKYGIAGIASWCVAIYFFTLVAPWTTAVEVRELEARYAAEAHPSWNAAVTGHGRVKEWKRGTIQENPVGFWAAFTGMLCAAGISVAMAVMDAKQRRRK